MLLTEQQKKEMEKFVDFAFLKWGWDSNAKFRKKLGTLWREMARKLKRTTSPKEKSHITTTMQKRINFLTKERRNYRRSFQLEWMFSTEAMVTGLKYDPLTSSFLPPIYLLPFQHRKGVPKTTKSKGRTSTLLPLLLY